MSTQVAKIDSEKQRLSPLAKFADKFNIDPVEMERVLKTTVFRQTSDCEVTNEQMVALMIVSSEYNLNPFTREIYAFPSNNGVVPIVSVDGWANLINSNKMFNGMEWRESSERITLKRETWNYQKKCKEQISSKPCPEWIECVIHRKDREYPTVIREYLDECFKPTQPWCTHTKRMLRHKTMIQAGRVAFSLSGIYDEDEANDIVRAELEINEPPQSTRPHADDRPVNQSRTEQLISAIEIVDEVDEEPQADEIESVNNDKNASHDEVHHEKGDDNVKNLTKSDKTRLLEEIEKAETVQDLNNLTTELSGYDKLNPLLIPIRSAWQHKFKQLNSK